ncbi:hypothetical protein yaldo0001_21780 [Yersinia aldovae ATCC 35236]|nr:hypothetical protein yaldo0001_21780 [Yersinia aldovae ATCC 35236]
MLSAFYINDKQMLFVEFIGLDKMECRDILRFFDILWRAKDINLIRIVR